MSPVTATIIEAEGENMVVNKLGGHREECTMLFVGL